MAAPRAASADALGAAHDPKLRSQLGRALVVASFGAIGALAVAFELPLCLSAALFGVPCPGCGLTRATLALLHGDVRAALHFHPLVFVLAPLVFWFFGAEAFGYVCGPGPSRARSLLSRRAVTWGAWLLLAALLGVWVARFFGAFGGPVAVRSLAVSPGALFK